MNILVLQPIRPNHPAALRERATALLDVLPDANPGMSFDIRQDDSALDIPPHPSLYMKHATVRNYMLDRYLRDEHTHVLWVDSDLVEYPADLPTRLAKVHEHARWDCDCGAGSMDTHRDTCVKCGRSYPRPGAIAAPLALLSPTSGWHDRFYDIGGFVEDGARARMWKPWFNQTGDVIELDSVGCCYLAPAELYRSGIRYSPPPTDYYVEHWSVMREARARGYRVCALTTTHVIHAWLPDYGLGAN